MRNKEFLKEIMEIIANHFGLGSSIYVLNARQMITERREKKNVDDVEFVN